MSKKKLLSLLYILISVATMAVLAYTDTQLHQFDFKTLPGLVNWLWIAAALISVMLYYLSDALLIFRSMIYINHPVKFSSVIKIALIGFYYSALTPFSTGGQPVQVIYMTRYGAPVGRTTSVFVFKLLLWEFVLCVLGAWALFYNKDILSAVPSSMIIWGVFGFVANLGAFFIGVASILLPKQLLKLGMGAVRGLSKIRIIRDVDRANLQITRTIEDFNAAAEIVRTHRFMAIELLIETLFNMLAFFSITFFIYRALGNYGQSWLSVVLLQALLYVAVSFVPLPGASGASEGGFYIVFSTIFTGGTTFLGVMLWRLLTYYLSLLSGFVIIMADGFKSVKKSG